MHVVIVGNGIAGINVAASLGVAGSVSVEVFAGESHPLYSRVRLPEVLAGFASPESITFYKPEWYVKKNITVHAGKTVGSIDRSAKEITLTDGTKVHYDFLVLATGASANRPPIPGSNLSGVFTIRTMEDVAVTRAHLERYRSNAAVIGGGLLGLEAARALKDAGAGAVRVFELFPRLLPRQLDETGAALLQNRFAAMGIEVVCCAQTESLRSDPLHPSRVASIAFKDGGGIPAETVLLSMGVTPNTQLAKEAGLTVNRGIVVDNRLRTDDPCIYAVGDCAEFEGIVWGIVPAALEQAPVLAKSILAASGLISEAEAPAYSQTVPKTALKVGDIELMSLGKAVLTPEETASARYTVSGRVWEDASRYEKFVLGPADLPGASEKGLVLSGAILYGSKKHQSAVQKLMGQPVSPREIEALLAD